MSIRSQREKSKTQEKYQTTLSQMLKEEDNKYCVDCDTKSKERIKTSILLDYHIIYLFFRSSMG